jgi:TonB family protein
MKLSPSFAPAYNALGVLFAMQGKHYDEAHQWIQKSIQMDPGNVEFRIDDANVLMWMNRSKDAIELASKLAHTHEQTAAVENVLQSARKFIAAREKTEAQPLALRFPGAQTGGKGAAQVGGPSITSTRAIYTPKPDYTEEARQARREGVCVVSLIVSIDGKPSNIVVTKKLGLGLDEKAIEAVRRWRFEPARKNGKAVMTRLNLSVSFKLFGGSDKILELSQKAKAGDAAAEFELANALFAGRDIPKDQSQGAALLERVARDGLPQAQFQMGDRTLGRREHPR